MSLLPHPPRVAGEMRGIDLLCPALWLWAPVRPLAAAATPGHGRDGWETVWRVRVCEREGGCV